MLLNKACKTAINHHNILLAKIKIMINETELRKGNIVKCLVRLPVGFHRPMLAHSRIVELRENVVETNEGFYKYTDIDPIPLTEELLLKSGGEKCGDDKIAYTFKDEDAPDIFILQEDDSFYLSDKDDKKKYSIKISSIHHFQNLYYALRKKEVVINLD